LSPLTHAFDREKTRELVVNFIHDRLRGYLVERGARPDEFDAVLGVSPQSLVDFERRLAAVRDFRLLPEAESLSAANKRIRNILRKSEDPRVANVDESILQDPLEKTLLKAARDAREATTALLSEGHYGEALKRLASLREPVDAFFEGVMVMADDPALKANRIGLLSIIEGLFLDIADISRLQG
jgi:glycyl-tRNA synthetase beta chain